jgi:hypothetical protein
MPEILQGNNTERQMLFQVEQQELMGRICAASPLCGGQFRRRKGREYIHHLAAAYRQLQGVQPGAEGSVLFVVLPAMVVSGCQQELGGRYMVGDQDIREARFKYSANGGDIGRASTCDQNHLRAFGDPLLELRDREPGEVKGRRV